MSKILTPNEIEQFGRYLYNCLPEIYRNADRSVGNLTLERFLDALNTQGFAHINKQIVGLIDLSQISKCKEEHLELFASSLGCDWIGEVPMSYRRKLLTLLITLYKKKGTRTSIEYLAKELSGFEVEIIEDYIPDEYLESGDELKRLFTIKLLAPEVDDPITSKESEVTITRIIGHFVPVHSKYIVLVSYFYDEPHKLRTQWSNTDTLVQNIGEYNLDLNRVANEVIDKLKLINEQETNFDMMGQTDELWRLTNPTHLLTRNLRTVSIKYDDLHHSKITYADKYIKSFNGEPVKADKIVNNYDYGNIDLIESVYSEFNQILKNIYDNVTNFEMIGTENYTYSSKTSKNDGQDAYVSGRIVIGNETQHIKQKHDEESNLEVSNTKVDRVKCNSGEENITQLYLGIDTKVMQTCNKTCTLSNIGSKLTTLPYVDKVIQGDKITIIY